MTLPSVRLYSALLEVTSKEFNVQIIELRLQFNIALTLCGPETLHEFDLQRKKYNTITCDLSVYTMYHPDVIVCSYMGNFVCLEGFNNFSLIADQI